MTETIIIILLCAALVWGWSRGIVRQLGSLASFLIGLIAVYLFGSVAAEVVENLAGVTDETPVVKVLACDIIGRGLLFLLVWLAAGVFTRTVHQLVRMAHLGAVNSLLGALFMAIKFAIVISVLLNLWGAVSPQAEQLQNPGPLTQALGEFGPALLNATAEI